MSMGIAKIDKSSLLEINPLIQEGVMKSVKLWALNATCLLVLTLITLTPVRALVEPLDRVAAVGQ